MQTQFPKLKDQYLKADSFQDREVLVTFQGWEKKANEDDPPTRKNAQTWKQKLKYQLKYSYPEYAIDEAGEKRLGEDGQPFKNSNYDPAFPQGYSIIYHFIEGKMDSGSVPLWRAFCRVAPEPGDELLISRTGKDNIDKKWFIKKPTRQVATTDDGVPEIDFNDPKYSGDPEVNKDEVPF